MRQTTFSTLGYNAHPVLGRVYQAGSLIQGTEGYSKTSFNSLGMRGPELNPKLPGEFRVLALGDSFTEALHVEDNETFSWRLEHALKKHYGEDSRVINAGRAVPVRLTIFTWQISISVS